MVPTRRSKGAKSLFKNWAFYVLVAQVIAGCVQALVATTLVDRFTRWTGTGVGIIIIVSAILGLIGVAYRLEGLVNLHVLGAILALSVLFPLRFQVVRNTSIDCAIAELNLINANLADIAFKQIGRSTDAFNMMMMRIKAMSYTIDHLHAGPGENIFNSTSPSELRKEENEHVYYKHVWKMADEHFVSEQLQHVRDSAQKLMETLKEKLAKRVSYLDKKYEKDGLEKTNVDLLESAVNTAIETASTAMRRTHEHLQKRLPEDELSVVELDKLIITMQRSMENLQEILSLVESEIGGKKNPVALKRFSKHFGENGNDFLGGILVNAEAVKEAMDRQQKDIYDSVVITDLQQTREGYRQMWLDMMISKVNKTALDDRSYISLLPKKCLRSRKQESTVNTTGLLLIFLLSLSLYLTFSLGFKLAVLSQTSI